MKVFFVVMHLPSPGGTRPLSMSLECTWGPKMVKEATCFLCFPFSEAQHLCGWHGRWAQCAADWRQIRLGCFGFPLPHGKRLGWAFSTQRSCVMLQDLHWDGTLVLAPTGRAKSTQYPTPKRWVALFVVHQRLEHLHGQCLWSQH